MDKIIQNEIQNVSSAGESQYVLDFICYYNNLYQIDIMRLEETE